MLLYLSLPLSLSLSLYIYIYIYTSRPCPCAGARACWRCHVLLSRSYPRSPLQDSRLFGPSPWKILAAINEKDISEQPSPWRKSSKRESCYGDRCSCQLLLICIVVIISVSIMLIVSSSSSSSSSIIAIIIVRLLSSLSWLIVFATIIQAVVCVPS